MSSRQVEVGALSIAGGLQSLVVSKLEKNSINKLLQQLSVVWPPEGGAAIDKNSRALAEIE